VERLEREALANGQRNDLAASAQWLAVLRLLAPGAARKAAQEGQEDAPNELGGAVRILSEYVESGKLGAYTEYHCACRMHVMAAWTFANSGDLWFEAPMPVAGEEKRLRECVQIDRWHATEAAPSAGR
jgi:hypothetical protein